MLPWRWVTAGQLVWLQPWQEFEEAVRPKANIPFGDPVIWLSILDKIQPMFFFFVGSEILLLAKDRQSVLWVLFLDSWRLAAGVPTSQWQDCRFLNSLWPICRSSPKLVSLSWFPCLTPLWPLLLSCVPSTSAQDMSFWLFLLPHQNTPQINPLFAGRLWPPWDNAIWDLCWCNVYVFLVYL